MVPSSTGVTKADVTKCYLKVRSMSCSETQFMQVLRFPMAFGVGQQPVCGQLLCQKCLVLNSHVG